MGYVGSGAGYAIWHSQVAIIVAPAHVAGVIVAHALALRLAGPAAGVFVSAAHARCSMIGYTYVVSGPVSTPGVG